MRSSKEKHHTKHRSFRSYLKSRTFQRMLICVLTIMIAFIIIEGGALPKKYVLHIGQPSPSNITAPRDIVNLEKVKQKAELARKSVPPVTSIIKNAPLDVTGNVDKFFTSIKLARRALENEPLEQKQKEIIDGLNNEIESIGIILYSQQVDYLASRAKINDDDLFKLESNTRELVINAMKEDITADNLANKIDQVQRQFQKLEFENEELEKDLRIIGGLIARGVLKPNKIIDDRLTEAERNQAYKDAYEEAKNTEKIKKGERIISAGETVTQNTLTILEELNLLETKSRVEFAFAIGILMLLLLLSAILIIYMNYFCKKVLYSRNNLLILSITILLTILIARLVTEYTPEYAAVAVPIFIAPMLISILLDLRLAGVVSFILTIAISLLIKDDVRFIYMAAISGSIAAFFVSKANLRSRLSLAGIVIGFVNVLIVVCLGIINKSDTHSMFVDSLVAFFNGVICTILTIGMLPFWESAFNVITPTKLLELTNPDQPLIKRLLMEAPGTYHHSLMVGNLAEVATESIGGNALLARVGAYYHDIGKLKRPGFFKENQLSNNPHDSMTPNLSTLIITSHINDGMDLANKNKIPAAVKDIICQHHGNTLVAYFYHKAKTAEKGDLVNEQSFRYQGPRPATKEAAVVMLADSVEAAVRSMPDKTEGKIEGLIRKIIKDKLDDGQLDLCSLTLKDLDMVAKAFMRVLSGFFHGREQYPDVKVVKQELGVIPEKKPVESEEEKEKGTDGNLD